MAGWLCSIGEGIDILFCIICLILFAQYGGMVDQKNQLSL